MRFIDYINNHYAIRNQKKYWLNLDRDIHSTTFNQSNNYLDIH